MKNCVYLNSFVTITMMLLVGHLSAQPAVDELLKKVKKANSSEMICYDYTVTIKNLTENRLEDSLKGRMYKAGNNFLDSNETTISSVNKGIYCKLEFDNQVATVFSIDRYKERLGIASKNLTPSIIDLSDTVIAKYGKTNVRKLKDGYRIEVIFPKNEFPGFVLELDDDELLVRKITFEVIEKDRFGDATGYSKHYLMENFKYHFDTRILSQDRFFKMKNENVILTKKYSKYYLNTITN